MLVGTAGGPRRQRGYHQRSRATAARLHPPSDRLGRDGRHPKNRLEGGPHRRVDLRLARRDAEIDERRHPVFVDAAGHDALKMAEVRLDVDRHAMKRHPFAHAHADRCDLVFPGGWIGRRAAAHPDADPAVAPFANDVELGQCGDQPVLQVRDKAPDVAAAFPQIQHDVADPLAGPVVGIAPAAAGLVYREARRVNQFGRIGAGAGRIEGGMLEEPYLFRRAAGDDPGDAGFHGGDGVKVVDRIVVDPPLHRLVLHRRRCHGLGNPRSGRSAIADRRLIGTPAFAIPAHEKARPVFAASDFAVVAELVDAQR